VDDKFKGIKSCDDLGMLNGLAFEEYLRQMFVDLGYKVKKTQASGDYGGDLVLTDGEKTIAVQAKQYAKPVGFDAVKEVHFAKDYYKTTEAWIVAPKGFTPQAINGARKVGVRLICDKELEKLIAQAHEGANVTESEKRRKEKELITTAVIPAGTVHIEKGAFADCVNLKSINLPSSLKSIGPEAFKNCKHLIIKSLPEGITAIGEEAFCGCSSLALTSLPKGVTSIGDRAFCGCSSLALTSLPEGVTSIGDWAFYGCSSLALTSLPERRGRVDWGLGILWLF
jgi:hypothetical protein